MSNSGLSRRQMIVRAAAAAAGLGLAMSITAAARKAEAKVDPTPDPDADNVTLNALLKAELDAVATYTAGAAIIAGDTVTPQATRDLVTAVAVHFQDQHKQHGDALKALIVANGGTPTSDPGMAHIPASFPTATADTTAVIKLAADKEKQAAYTYANVMKTVSTQTAAKLVAAIGAVESQHFLVLYLLAEGFIQPNASTANMVQFIVPAAFVADVGGSGTQSLENFPALDAVLTLD